MAKLCVDTVLNVLYVLTNLIFVINPQNRKKYYLHFSDEALGGFSNLSKVAPLVGDRSVDF